MKTWQLLTLLVMGMLVVGACGAPEAPTTAGPAATTAVATTTPTAEAATGEPVATEAAPVEASADLSGTEAVSETEPVAMAEPTEAEGAVERPDWQLLPLTDARTGASFTLADFAGKTVYVEPFATWCSNCRQQMTIVNQVRPNFGEDVVFIALSVEPNIGDEVLAQYASDEGFDFIFAAMSPDLLREMVAIFGQTVTNPPATPHFIIRGDGSTTELFTGIEGPDVIANFITSNQG